MLGRNKASFRTTNNNNEYSDYDIWRITFSFINYSIAVLKVDDNNSELFTESLSRFHDYEIGEFSSIEELSDFVQGSDSEYTLFMTSDCIIDSNIFDVYSTILDENPDIDIIYSDEDIYSIEEGRRRSPFFKPCFSPDTLMSFPYIGKVFLFRTSLIDEVGRFDSSLGEETYYDFLLRCFDLGKNFRHSSKVLFSQIREDDYEYYEVNDNIRICQENSLIRRNIFATLVMDPKGHNYTIDYKWDDKPLVSIIIPSKDNYDVLKRCIDSIIKLTFYKNYEIVVVDNGSSSDNKAKYSEYATTHGVKYIYDEKKFNFSYMCNVGVKNSSGEYLLFLNDDTKITDTMWLTKMLGQAMLPYSGAIGAKLLFGDRTTIQHCGVINNVGPTHAFWGFNDAAYYYFGRNIYVYNYLGVTAACLCVKRSKFEEVSGFNEELTICYNDVDLCYKLVEKGYYNTVRNDVVLIHYESVSRGSDYQDEATKSRLLKERSLLESMHPNFVKYDPFYNVNLTSQKVDFDLHELVTNRYLPVDIQGFTEVKSAFNIDSILVERLIKIRGWIVNDMDLKTANCSVSIILKSDNAAMKVDAVRQIRLDVQKSLSLNVSDVGFMCIFPKGFLNANEKYVIGINVTDSSGAHKEVVWTENYILF